MKENIKVLLWMRATEARAGAERAALKRSIRRALLMPSRRGIEVSLQKLERSTGDGDNVIVPGKVLASGRLTRRLNISALAFSTGARRALEKAGCNVMELGAMLKQKRIKIIT